MAVMDDGWEQRMAERAADRRRATEAKQAALHAKAQAELGDVLAAIDPLVYHGQHVSPDRQTVTMGNGIFCAGCGVSLGCFSIALTEGYVPESRPDPDWPYPPDSCPVCAARGWR